MSDELEWSPSAERGGSAPRKMAFGAVAEEARAKPLPRPPRRAHCSCGLPRERGSGLDFSKNDVLLSLTSRLRLLREHFPALNFPELDEISALETLNLICTGLTSFAELAKVDLSSALLASLDPKQRRLLETETPERVRLPGGRSVEVHYEADRPPWIESRLQDFFGMPEGPKLCRGRVPLDRAPVCSQSSCRTGHDRSERILAEALPSRSPRADAQIPEAPMARGRSNRDAARTEATA